MKTFLGIQLYQQMTDAEFIERTRNNLKWAKRVAWIHLAVVVAMSILIPKFFGLINDTIKEMPDDFRKWAWSGLMFGIVMGTVLATYLTKAAEAIAMGFGFLQGNRRDKLLVECHDMLTQLAKERPGCVHPGGADTSPAARSAQPGP